MKRILVIFSLLVFVGAYAVPALTMPKDAAAKIVAVDKDKKVKAKVTAKKDCGENCKGVCTEACKATCKGTMSGCCEEMKTGCCGGPSGASCAGTGACSAACKGTGATKGTATKSDGKK